MQLKRILGTATALGAVSVAVVLYTAHPVKSSDHQDTYNLATRGGANSSIGTSADITDVYVYQSPSNANNVVFAMDVSPLITPGTGLSHFFDPTLLYQFKISHQTSGVEDQVIQIAPSGTGASQTLNMYLGAPAKAGTVDTIISATPTGIATYNKPNTSISSNTISLFGGPRTDPFFFDLFAFFTFAGDRNYGTHTSQSDPGPETAANPEGLSNGDDAANLSGLAPAYDQTSGGNPGPKAPSFNGFAAGTMSNTNPGSTTPYNPALGAYACSTNPASDTLFAGPFDVLSLVVEVPKSLISGAPYNTSNIHVWATTASSTQN